MNNKSDNKVLIDKLNNRFISFFICIVYSVFAFLVVCSFANLTFTDGALTIIGIGTVIPLFIFMSYKPSRIFLLSSIGLFLVVIFALNFKDGGLNGALSPFLNFFNDFYLVFIKFTKVPLSSELVLLIVISIAISLFTYVFTSWILNPQVLFLFATLALMFQIITGGLKNSIYFIFLIGISLFAVFFYVYQYTKTISSYKDVGFFRVIAPAAIITVVAFLISVFIPYFEIPAIAKNIQNGNKNVSYYSFNDDGDEKSEESLLGGPIDPDDVYLFSVKTDNPVKLMGSVKTVYTGKSWTFTDRNSNRYNGQKSIDSSEISFNLQYRKLKSEFANSKVYKITNPTNTVSVPALLTSFEGESDAPFYIADDGTVTSKGLTKDSSYFIQSNFINLQDDDTEKWLKSCHKGYYDSLKDFESDDGTTLAELKVKSNEVYSSCLQLPESLPDRVYNKAKEITEGLSNDYDKAEAIATYLSSYTYSLNPEELSDDEDFVDHFLFTEKKGYCTYYASAFTVLCRCAGIPARYVEGYNLPVNSVKNDDDSYTYKITNKEAHTWSQVYFEGAGWITFEPTAPYRYVEMGEDAPADIFENPQDAEQFEEQVEETPTEDNPDTPEDPQDVTEDESSGGENTEDVTEPTTEADDEKDNPQKEDSKNKKGFILKIIIPVISLILIIFIIYFVTGSARKRKWYRLRNTITASRAIKMLYKESLKALNMIGLSPAKNETLDEFFSRAEKEIKLGYLPSEVFNRIIYGNKRATEKEREFIIKYFDDVKTVVSRDIPKIKKFLMIDFLHKI